MLSNYNDILSVKEVCEILHLCKNKVYELLNKGDIKARRIGRKFLIPKASLIDFINSVRYTTV